MKDNLQEQEHPQKEINFCENCDSIIHFSATFCDESCRLNYEENQSKPILQDNEIGDNYDLEAAISIMAVKWLHDAGANINGNEKEYTCFKQGAREFYDKYYIPLTDRIKSLKNKIQELENDYMKIQTELQTAKFIKDKTSR